MLGDIQRPLRVLTWQVHGNYLFYLSQVPVQWYVVTKPGYPPGYGALGPGLPWGDNIREVPAEQVRELQLDCVLYQSQSHWQRDRDELLSESQRRLPCIVLEHDPPQQHPTNTEHWADDADLLVHVTAFNALMWNSGRQRTQVIDHTAVIAPEVAYGGASEAGICVINHLLKRGRRLGCDIYLHAQAQVPLALAGMGSTRLPGGIGEIVNDQLPQLMSQYRYLFHPVRWTSLGLSVIEAMAIGMPIVGIASTELVTVVENGCNGWIDTDPDVLVEVMHRLSHDPDTARRWGRRSREIMRERFSPERFVERWLRAFDQALERDCARTEPRRRVA